MKIPFCFYSCASFCVFYLVLMSFLCGGSNSEKAQETIVTDKQEGETKITSERQKRKSPLETKFSIQGPKIHYEDKSIHLDYTVGEWVTRDILQYRFDDFECKNHLDENSLPLLADPVGLVELDTLDKEDGIDEPEVRTWRLPLKLPENSRRKIYVCIRWMLFNLPSSHEYSIEVNFVQSQLAIRLARDGSISDVKLTQPESIGVQVNVGGRGRVAVHPDNDEL